MNAPQERVVRFYAVGLIGSAVQLVVLYALTDGIGLDYLLSTALAVETAIIHNFLWHQRWTWRCRTSTKDSAALRLQRFSKFNMTAGMVSLMTNLVVTRLLVEYGGMRYLTANLVAIAAGSAVTFLLSETFAFNAARRSAASLRAPAQLHTCPRVRRREHIPTTRSEAADT